MKDDRHRWNEHILFTHEPRDITRVSAKRDLTFISAGENSVYD
jgi:hypothetical protein